MGIQGLLPLLKSIHKPCNLKRFAGQTIGVDAYGWLHRGTVSCAIELAQDKPTSKFVDFAMNRVRMLIYFGVKPYLVFDGDYLPSKAGTEQERAARRSESKRLGLELLRMGRTSQAHLELQKSVDVTPEMARQLIEELKKAKVDYVVAPYEADSQLVYLERRGTIQGILSEDSDMLVFGAKRLLTKLDQYGDCIMINREDFTACREVSFAGWSDAEFRCMAILSGCDYLPGIDKMGLKTAHRLMRKHKTVDRVVRFVQFDGKMKVPAGYLDSFRQAESTFLYQWVYCPDAKCLVNLTDPAESVDVPSMGYIGMQVDAITAAKVARGDLHPHTKRPLDVPDIVPRSFGAPMRTSSAHETPDLKRHQSIESFFKPKRTPLAELDPNSFTPSPSQQRLLEQNLVAWSAEPLDPRRTISAAMTAPNRPISQSMRRTMSEAHPGNTSNSPKRQRLCSDNASSFSLESGGRQTAAASRFFAMSASTDSPSLKKGAKAKQSATEMVNIWSDDSIDEALSQLPDVSTQTSTKKTKKFAVFQDEDASAASQASLDVNERAESQTTTIITKSSGPSLDADEETPATSVSSSAVESKASSLVLGESLAARFSAPRGEDSARPRNPAGLRAVDPSLAFHDDDHRDAILCSSPPRPPGEARLEHQDIRDPADDFCDADWLTVEGLPVSRISGLGMKANPCSKEVLKGSEDLLVPDSEGEEECGNLPSFGLNLGKFAFAG